MKKIGIFVLTAVLALTMFACKKNDMGQPDQKPGGTTPPASTPSIMPTMPTMEPNIPDPEVEPTDGTGEMPGDGQDETGDPMTRSRFFR